MSNHLVGVYLPPEAFRKLKDLARNTYRNQSQVVTILVMAAEAQADGSLHVNLPAGETHDAAA
jgi:hypothetical protein